MKHMRLKQDITMIFKGLKEIHTIRPWLLTLAMVGGMFSALTPFVNIYMGTRIINGIVGKQTFRELLWLSFLTVILNAVIQLCASLLNHFMKLLQEEFGARYDMRLNRKLADLEYSVVEDANTYRMRQQIYELRNMNGGGIWKLLVFIGQISGSIVTIVFSVTLTISLFITPSIAAKEADVFTSFVVSPWFSAILVVGILVNVVISMYSNCTATRKSNVIMNDIIPFNRVFGFYLTAYISNYHAGKEIRIYDQKNLIEEESMALFDDAYHVLNKLASNQVKFALLSTLFSMFLSTVIYIFVGLKALVGVLSVGFVVQYIGSIHQFTEGCTHFMTQLVELRTNNEALAIYFAFIELPSVSHTGERSVNMTDTDDFNVEFHHVSFRYPNANEYALRDINLTFRRGEKIALVGMNGSGKTTVIKLLCRLYKPTDGKITINGVNIEDYRYDEYMKLFATVFQDFKVFAFDVGQNVAARVNYNATAVRECLEKVGFGARLASMPYDLRTPLYKNFDENGVEISGGEAQKIALARALYKHTPFIILDEPTAALDPLSEYEVYSKFSEITSDKTAVYISHRMSSCRFCDHIVVLHQGYIVQSGPHEVLLADTQGKYYELWHAQAQYYTSS